ncbi:N-acetyltransferase [Candidatus Parcubacteria bacterium]|nr:MAG: N-acetyltransferase [Candidatus Parcubacteria bacterium]
MAKIRTKSTGRILKKWAIGGKNVIFRHPKASDAKELMNLINSLVEERAEIAKTTKVTPREEKKWLANALSSIRKKEKIMIIVEVNGIIVGSCEVTQDSYDVSRHVGTLGIGLRKDARGFGIGKKLVQLCLCESKKTLGLKMIRLYVFDTNKTGRRFYKKIGFKETGRIPRGVFQNGKYKDDVIMVKRL